MYLTIVPAYGRDYKSKKEVEAAWEAGKDFQINDMSSPDDGRYINKDDATPGMVLNIRYDRLQKVHVVKVKPPVSESRIPSFLEYLNDKGKIIDKPDVETVPDYHGPQDTTPPNSKVPYKTPVANKAPAKGENGLAELGDDKLKYEPKTKLDYEVKKDALKKESSLHNKIVQEYVDENGKLVTKARVDINAKYTGKVPNAPEGKGALPYVAKDATTKKGTEKGLGELGEEDFVYEPNTEKADKVKTEGFLNKTKGMSLAEFTRYMLEECGCGQVEDESLPYVTAYTTGKFQPHPPEVIRYISALADKNQGILENLVSTAISMGYLGKLLKAIFQHPQAYEELTSLFSDEEGPTRCKSFVTSMNNSYKNFLADQDGLYESVSSPIGFDVEEDDDDEEEYPKDEEEAEDAEENDEEFGDEDSIEGEDAEYDDEMGDEEELEDSESEESEEDFDEENPEESEEVDVEDEGEAELDSEEKPRRLKKKFAHHHLLDAMKNHEYMLKAMRGE